LNYIKQNIPYISVAFANRNDNYGGELSLRIERFIDYYEPFVKADPDLFEFIICDWNPPADKPSLRKGFEWNRLGNVVHLEVSEPIHKQYSADSDFPIMDYTARNAAIRRSKGDFCLILNHDIYVSKSIIDVLMQRNLDKNSFYRADRVDYDFTESKIAASEELEKLALKNAFLVCRKHSSNHSLISNEYNVSLGDKYFSTPETGDLIDQNENSIISVSANNYRDICLEEIKSGTFEANHLDHDLYQQFYLHTNASGDFILAPKEAFFKIQGLIETSKFYMHLDGYGIFQLFAAGYTQRVFQYPHMIFHADHDRSARADRREGMTYEEHKDAFSKILTNQLSYKLNDSNWGLAKYDIFCKEDIDE